jgi:hypothetical protein
VRRISGTSVTHAIIFALLFLALGEDAHAQLLTGVSYSRSANGYSLVGTDLPINQMYSDTATGALSEISTTFSFFDDGQTAQFRITDSMRVLPTYTDFFGNVMPSNASADEGGVTYFTPTQDLNYTASGGLTASGYGLASFEQEFIQLDGYGAGDLIDRIDGKHSLDPSFSYPTVSGTLYAGLNYEIHGGRGISTGSGDPADTVVAGTAFESFTFTPAPEPSSLAAIAVIACSLFAARRRRI